MSLANLAALAGSGVACGYAVIEMGRALLARRWPTVQGEIIDARVVRLSGDETSKALDRVVTYRYQVAGKTYSNNRVQFGLQPAPSSIVPALDTGPHVSAALAAEYPRGKPVRVYYNPRRPENSVLYPAPNLRVWAVLAAGLYLAYFAFRGAL